MVCIGFITGILGRLALEWKLGMVPWTDPVVLSLALMSSWLVTAEIFRKIYPAAQQGRKVAYLTFAAFLFLVITLASVTLFDTLHATPPVQPTPDRPNSSQTILNSHSGHSWNGQGGLA